MILSFCLLFILTGTLYYQFRELGVRSNGLCEYNDKGQEITFRGIVSEEPDIRSDKIKLKVKVEQLVLNNEEVTISGKVLVTINRYLEYDYGDKLEIKGKLKTPQTFEGFNYKGYLEKEGVSSVMYWPRIKKINGKEGNIILENIIFFKNKLRQVIYKNLSPPQETILASIILGDKRRMSDDLKDKLSIAGVRHITAISGMHITMTV